ncbi:MAG TPA: hypothetical protein DCG33_01590 [Prevotellaceae bacterium]|nr:hypothetical protein [Prevotellaceae bacterium]
MAQTNLEDFSLSLVKEDSISLLSIKPVKHPKKLLKQVIAQFQEDRMQYKEGTYQIDAIFLRDSLAPLSVRCTIPAKAGITFDESYPGFYESTSDFTCEEPYKLFRNDSIYLGKYLRAFARLNPIWAPWTYQVPIGTLLPNIKLRVHLAEPLYPLKQYNTTVAYYDISAYHVADASGRGVYRFVFDRNREIRLFKYDGRKYDVGEVTGVTYFDSQTLHITKFKGRARLISDQHIVLIRYNIDYDTDDGNPVLRRIKIAWEAGGTSINATVRRL